MSSVRSIALLLSMLPAGDRRWLLGQLEPAQQLRIEPELRAVLQLPPATRRREAARVSQGPVLQDHRTAADPREPDELQPLIARLDQVEESRMTALWRGSPDWLLQAFLSIHSWRCRTALQSLLPSSRGQPVVAPAQSGMLRRKLLEAVLAALERSGPVVGDLS
ncbi:hypothetical protein D0B54_04940 [Solimonas sp. K1W22B-7]|uniref:hypothetical protein n=1 Tax=Solimonas sp. K1W22B-7 TaxID=2303331 RepID=UPI000E335109|nr:hypothetical protein [Solimonas sp. K1W22B-7]AXQ28059.1 hypothetical protein D0B54_04940 [Solimonas sp. K1W22B-7]